MNWRSNTNDETGVEKLFSSFFRDSHAVFLFTSVKATWTWVAKTTTQLLELVLVQNTTSEGFSKIKLNSFFGCFDPINIYMLMVKINGFQNENITDHALGVQISDFVYKIPWKCIPGTVVR